MKKFSEEYTSADNSNNPPLQEFIERIKRITGIQGGLRTAADQSFSREYLLQTMGDHQVGDIESQPTLTGPGVTPTNHDPTAAPEPRAGEQTGMCNLLCALFEAILFFLILQTEDPTKKARIRGLTVMGTRSLLSVGVFMTIITAYNIKKLTCAPHDNGVISESLTPSTYSPLPEEGSWTENDRSQNDEDREKEPASITNAGPNASVTNHLASPQQLFNHGSQTREGQESPIGHAADPALTNGAWV